MKFAVDAFGADKGEAVVVEGCIRALKEMPSLEIVLVGDLDVINPMLEKMDRIKVKYGLVE